MSGETSMSPSSLRKGGGRANELPTRDASLISRARSWRFRSWALFRLASAGSLLVIFTLLNVSWATNNDASIGDLVWSDRNGNGAYDTGEPGLAGVKVTLGGAGADGVFGNGDDLTFLPQTTNASGNYSFTQLAPGSYRADIDLLTVPDLKATTARPLTVSLAESQVYLNADFGFARPEWVTLSISPAAVTNFAGNGQNQTLDANGTGAALKDMGGVAISGSFAYVGTTGSIRKVNLSTGDVTTLAGHATATGCTDSVDSSSVRFTDISSLATDGYYLYSWGSGCTGIRRTSVATGATSMVTSSTGGHITYGPDGYLYVQVYNEVKKIHPINGTVSTFWGTGGSGNAPTNPLAITSDATDLWVGFYATYTSSPYRIYRVPLSGAAATLVWYSDDALTSLASSGNYFYSTSPTLVRRHAKSDATWIGVARTRNQGLADGIGTDAWFSNIKGIASDGTNLWISDSGSNLRLRKAVAASALPASQTSANTTLSINPAAVTTFAGNGQNQTLDGNSTAAAFKDMGGVAISGGYAYVGTTGSIRKVSLSTGEVTTLSGHPTATTSQDINLPGNSQAGQHSYTYDRAGRIASFTHPSVTGPATLQIGWDKAGNRTSLGSDTYTYDARNRLTQSTEPVGEILPVTTTRNFTYTPRGTLSQVSDGTTSQNYTFDSLSRLTNYQDALNSVAYTYDSLDRIATRGSSSFTYSGMDRDPVTDGTFTYSRSPGSRLMGLSKGTDARLAGLNRHGDLTHLFDTSASITDTKVYDPFGKELAETGSTDPNLGFQADFTDPASGKVWMGARWYAPNDAQFLSRDSVFGQLSTPMSLNRYTYAFGDPLNYFDPDGHWPKFIDRGIAKFKKTGFYKNASRTFNQATSAVKTATAEVSKTVKVQAARAQFKVQRKYHQATGGLSLKQLSKGLVSKDTAKVAGRGFSNFSTGFVDQASKALTFGKWSTNLGPQYTDDIYAASYKIGQVTAEVENAVLAVASGVGAVQAVRAAGGIRAAASLAGSRIATRVAGARQAIGSGASAVRAVMAGEQGAVNFGAIGRGARNPFRRGGNAPRGTSSSDDLAGQARAARDELAAATGSRRATVTGAYDVRTGNVVAGHSGPGFCAETHCVRQLVDMGSDSANVRFVEAARPRTGLEFPVCARCQAMYSRSQFPARVKHQSPGPWDDL